MVCLGYYIVELIDVPEDCTVNSKKLLSISNLENNIHPDFTACYFINTNKNRDKYAELLNLSEDEFNRFCEIISNMINRKTLAFDGRFQNYEDAVKIYSYFKHLDSIKLISLCTSKKYADELKEDGYFDAVGVSELKCKAEYLGCEILGSMSMGGNFSFESYLESNFQEDIGKHFDLKISGDNGLIQNNFEETEKFAEYIQNIDTAFHWIAYFIYKCNIL